MENNPVNGKKKFIPMAIALVLVAAALALVFWPGNLYRELQVEAGIQELSASAFLKKDGGENIHFLTDLAAIDFSVPGEHILKLYYKGREREAKLIIADTVAPEGQVQNVTTYAHHPLDPNAFVTEVLDVTEVTVSLRNLPDMTTEGTFPVTVVLTDLGGNVTEYGAELTVLIDETAPELAGVKPLVVYIGTRPDLLAHVTVTDNKDTDMTILVDDTKVNYDAVGTYDITYSVTDDAGHTTTAATTVTVSDDNVPPTIAGVQPISVYQGNTVSYRKGVQVTDDQDPAPALEILSEQVDLSTVGVYPLIYIARDATGNETRVEVTVTVVEKPEGYVEEDVINQKADELLKNIVTEDMTDEEKVRAIYAYVRTKFGYVSHSDKSDWMQGANVMMDQGRGDCFNYFAITKLFLERLEIPNIDVRKVKPTERSGDHYWSLVSVDGGVSYYHLDTTPRVGSGDDFCLVTDAFLDAYSDAHRKSHNRDKSLYPATPAE